MKKLTLKEKRDLIETHLAAFWLNGYNAGLLKIDSFTPTAQAEHMTDFIFSIFDLNERYYNGKD